jgi:hypothetical protein
LPGSPTIAIGIVTTPRLATGSESREVLVLAVVADDFGDEPHAVALSASPTSTLASAIR